MCLVDLYCNREFESVLLFGSTIIVLPSVQLTVYSFEGSQFIDFVRSFYVLVTQSVVVDNFPNVSSNIERRIWISFSIMDVFSIVCHYGHCQLLEVCVGTICCGNCHNGQCSLCSWLDTKSLNFFFLCFVSLVLNLNIKFFATLSHRCLKQFVFFVIPYNM